MKSSKVLMSALLALAVTSPLRAQAGDMPESYRTVQMNQLRLQRRTLLAMADSMPERLYRDKVTPIQRDFAQQIEHAAGSVPMVVNYVFHTPGPTAMDTAQYLNSRTGLKAFINAQYDWAEATLRNQSAAERTSTVTLFSPQNRMPGWQVWDELHEHTFWTAGQIVANFRKHGMAPPGFGFF